MIRCRHLARYRGANVQSRSGFVTPFFFVTALRVRFAEGVLRPLPVLRLTLTTSFPSVTEARSIHQICDAYVSRVTSERVVTRSVRMRVTSRRGMPPNQALEVGLPAAKPQFA